MSKISDYEFDIVVVAGQSNAEGNGRGDEELILKENPDVYEISDKNGYDFVKIDGSETDYRLTLTLPMERSFGLAKERTDQYDKLICGDICETFCNRYIADGRLKKGRKLLILKTAIGGSGFARKEWGVNRVLYIRMNDLIEYALKQNKKNKIVALLWHQGEHDVVENKGLTLEERYDFYYSKLLEQMQDFRRRYGLVPIIGGEMNDDYVENGGFTKECKVIEKATIDAFSKLEKASVVSSKGLLSNDQRIKNGDRAHFCRVSVYELGERYYKEYIKINKGTERL